MISILDTGAWGWNDSQEDHSCNLDKPFVNYLINFLEDKNQNVIIDFGCATGYYLQYISEISSKYELIGIEPQASKYYSTKFPNILDLDMTVPFDLNKKGVVMSLEVLEHIHPKFESIAVDNIVRHCDKYAFISWALQDGHGHVNCKFPQEVVDIFEKKQFKVLVEETIAARNTILPKAHASWLRHNFIIFEKVG
jgi:hypothetical protein